MAGISSKAANSLENNKNKFQNQEFAHHELSDGSGLDMYEFKYRMDDPQTGRFWQIDPLANDYVYNSTYAFSEDKVTSHVELEGLESASIHFPEGVSQKDRDDALKAATFQTSKSAEIANALPGVGLKIGIMAALVLQPEVGIPLAVGYLSGVPVTPSPQAMAISSTASASANLENQVVNTSAEMASNGRYPAAVVGASTSDGSTVISMSGKIPQTVAPKLLTASENVGGIGNVNAGKTVGCCAEFHAANELMLKNPTLNPTKINFTPAIRPRTMEVVPPCKNCITIFPQLQ